MTDANNAQDRPRPHSAASDDAAGYFEPGEPIADTKAPGGPLDQRWETRKFEARIANPANRRRLSIIVVGTGLAGASAAATLGEAGYVVKSFCYQDSPRRAHSIAAQGGINAAKNYKGDGDSVHRLFYDTIKGGDYRSRESNVYRLAEVSAEHHRPVRGPGRAVRPRVRRPAGQPLVRWSAGLADLLRPRADRPAAADRRLPGAGAPGRRGHGALLHPPRDARADRGRRPGARHHRPRHDHRRDRDLLRRRGGARLRRLRQRVLPVHQRDGLQRHRDLAGAPQGRLLRQPLLHPDPPDLHPGHRRPPVEADADERVAAQRRPDLGAAEGGRLPTRTRGTIPEEDRDYYLERIYPAFGNLVPRDIASRQAKNMCDEGRGVGPEVDGVRRGVYLDFADAIDRLGRAGHRGQATATSSTCTPRSPARTPTRSRCGSTRPCTT